jgi:hypothetical protein
MPRVAGLQAAAVGVRRERAADSQPSILDERAALALRAEAEVLERDEQHVGEGVVELAVCPVQRSVSITTLTADPTFQRMALSILSWMIASSSRPTLRRTSSVCSPSSGARVIVVRSSLNCVGLVTSWNGAPWIDEASPR